MNQRRRLSGKFVLCYINLCYLFDPAEMMFILHMIDIENMRGCGYSSVWSKDFMMKKMGLGERLFDRCVKRLMEIGLLDRKLVGNKYSYSLDVDQYEKLTQILTVTNDVHRLKSFCESVFVNGQRAIQDVTEEDWYKLEI